MNNNTTPAFTLIELLIVIAILSVLSVLGFMYMSDNFKNSRDVARIGDLDNVEKTLEIYFIRRGDLPLPDDATQVTYEDNTVWYQGTFGESVFKTIKTLSNKPVDPLSEIEYSYSVLNNKREYEIVTVFEGDIISYIPGVSKVYADTKTAYSIGSYNKKLVSVGLKTSPTIIALPSITSSRLESHDIIDILSNNDLVISGQSNLPANYNETLYDQSGNIDFSPETYIVFDGTSEDFNSPIQQRKFIQALQDTYKNDLFISQSDEYQELFDINPNNRQQVKNYIAKLKNKKVGGVAY